MARIGDEFELARIALIILINGAANHLKDFTLAAENLSLKEFGLIYEIYNICLFENKDLKMCKIEQYDEFLSKLKLVTKD